MGNGPQTMSARSLGGATVLRELADSMHGVSPLHLDLDTAFHAHGLRTAIRASVLARGKGRWRCREDLIDAAFDRVVDHVLASTATHVRCLVPYALEVLANLVRSGPPRVGLDDRRVVALPVDLEELATTAAAHAAPPPTPREIPSDSLQRLTPPERRAVHAVVGARSMTEAAVAAGMTKRDLRVRLGRAARKMRSDEGHG